MEAVELFNHYRMLSEAERLHFLRSLALYLDIELPDATHVLVPREEFARLVEVAKQVDELKRF